MKDGKLVTARANKFNAKRKIYGGVSYDSGMEADYGAYLDTLVLAKQIRGYRRQVIVSLDVRDHHGKLHHIANMRVDFAVEHNGTMAPDGSLEWVEVKGFATPEWLLKKKLFLALYPDRPYTVIGKQAKAIQRRKTR